MNETGGFQPPNKCIFELFYCDSMISDLDHSKNRKRERFKVFKVEPRSNRDNVKINLILIKIQINVLNV